MKVDYCLLSIAIHQLIIRKDTCHFHLQSIKRHKKLDVIFFQRMLLKKADLNTGRKQCFQVT